MKLPLLLSLLLSLPLLLSACQSKQQKQEEVNGAFAKAAKPQGENLGRIADSGELLIATLSGPDTYFDFQGVNMGLQYALAEDFAATLGVAVRVEVANDTTALITKLKKGEVDLIALQLPEARCQQEQLCAAGADNPKLHTSWTIRKDEPDLAEALNEWFGDGVEVQIERRERTRMKERHEVKRQVRAPYISREKGIISTYDAFFKQAAHHTGWDWRLIAAQCYQESGFDPNAISWAGAKGLMQLMPATAHHLGIKEQEVFAPKENIAAAARYIRELQGHFAHIADAEERVKFVLASYNGGYGHVNDAQALTRKYGGNPHVWNDVAPYILRLSEARYYRDPVVRHGYMIGAETYHYVQRILERWRQYGGTVRNLRPAPNTAFPVTATEGNARRAHKHNRYSKERTILTPEELRQRAEQGAMK